ncbi:MAG TPA: hypothetical protein PKI14_09770, partial [Fervidobacterium sp.]|nr:hypothetical protein [Fervidobacterium sp.]
SENMGLINLITKGMILGENFLAALTGRLDEGIIRIMSKDRKTRIKTMKKLKKALEDRGYDLSALTMKFQGYSRTVFIKADVFFERMNRYRVIYDLVSIYDEYGSEIDVGDIMEAMMYEEIFGDDDIDGWGDFGGFSGWD